MRELLMGKSGMHSSKSWLRRLLAQGWRNDRGNIAIISALAIVPLTMAVGMGLDVGVQHQHQEQLDGIADMTALFALNPVERGLTAPVAQAQAQAFWNAQTASLTGISSLKSSVVVTDTASGSGVNRVVKVSFSGGASTYISSIVGMTTLPISGGATSDSSVAPRINFYLLVDTSPSMAIAATTSGISTMVSYTGPQGGCAFACHENTPALDNLNNPNHITCVGDPKPNTSFPNGGEDNFALARCLGVTLRIDLVNQAVTNLMSTAATTAHNNNTVYGISVSTMDYQVGQLYQTNDIYSNLSAAQGQVGTLQQLEVDHNGCVTSANCNANNAGNDQDSALDAGVATLGVPVNLNSYAGANTPGYQMYAPGQGTANSGDSPQEVLFIVSDGVIDESYNGGRAMDPINTLIDNCTKIKNSGIRIAFLYLTYNPLPTNSFYNSNIAPFQPNIGSAAQKCASPSLYTEVNTNGDISGALTNLFQVAVSTARLTS